jgi:Helicase conserved C-terminal domain/PLD-like domain/Type III restriction enzyme, res subunit
MHTNGLVMADAAEDAFPLPRTWFDRKITLDHVRRAFASGVHSIRIACGFFTLRGWGLVRTATTGKQVFILVGIDEPGEERAHTALVRDIMRDLATGLARDRRAAVHDFVQRVRAGEARIVDARAMDHHAKLYLVDRRIAIITSANTTGRGFIEQIESGSINDDPHEVAHLVATFDAYFAAAHDITAELLRVLEEWLAFARPWDVYLKTMLALESLPSTSRSYKPPLSYQVDMITQTLRQLREYNGALVVASTGLGKTVVATHVAIRLFEAGDITNVMVIGPKAVAPIWKQEMRDAALPFDYFIHQSFDRGDADRDAGLAEFIGITETSADKRWLIILDESHEFRRRYADKMVAGIFKKQVERRAFARLMRFVREGGATVLELTGSPYAVDVGNINDQLLLLPHRAPRRTLFDGGRDDERAWHITDPSHFVDLPVASQLTAPHVAKYYSETDERGRYLRIAGQKRYVPSVTLHRVDVPLPWQKEMSRALPLLRTTARHPVRRANIEVMARIGWSSSPWALREVLRKTLDTPDGPEAYKVRFIFSQEHRRHVFAPILERLQAMTWEEDVKFLALRNLVGPIIASGRKILIFCERHPTALYLAEGLARSFPDGVSLACTVARTAHDTYTLKSDKEVQKLIRHFSPTANAGHGAADDRFNVFIATDAHGVGLNMQDASVVINYDTAWTPIEPTQRAGRVLRFWEEPRTVDLYTFVPTVAARSGLTPTLDAVTRRWRNLMVRHGDSQKLIDLAVLPTGTRNDIYLPDVASRVTMESGQLDLDALGDMDISPYFQHTARLQAHRHEALGIRDDIVSAMQFNGARPRVYVLVKHGETYAWPVYEPATGTLLDLSPVQLLHLIEATETTPTALVAPDEIEDASDACIRAWCLRSNVPPDDVQRICTLYLKPETEVDTMREWLGTQ